ncbi:MAG: hypothetical protein ABH811_01845 [archaeon]
MNKKEIEKIIGMYDDIFNKLLSPKKTRIIGESIATKLCKSYENSAEEISRLVKELGDYYCPDKEEQCPYLEGTDIFTNKMHGCGRCPSLNI